MAPTGVDPVTSRFSVSSAAVPLYFSVRGALLTCGFAWWSQFVTVAFGPEYGPDMARAKPALLAAKFVAGVRGRFEGESLSGVTAIAASRATELRTDSLWATWSFSALRGLRQRGIPRRSYTDVRQVRRRSHLISV